MLQSMGSQRVRHESPTEQQQPQKLSNFTSLLVILADCVKFEPTWDILAIQIGKSTSWSLFFNQSSLEYSFYNVVLASIIQKSYSGISSVQFSCSVVSDSLWPHESQHTRPLCPSPTPGVLSDSCPSSQWCHPAISSSVVPFSSCPQSLPASESFPMSQLFTWSGQSTGVSALASFHPKKSQGWSPSEWTGWISL